MPTQPAQDGGGLFGAVFNALGVGPDNARQREAAEDAQFRQFEAQFRPQFEYLLYAELATLRRTCKPDAKPFVEICRAAKADLSVPLRTYVRGMYGPRRMSDAKSSDPAVLLQQILLQHAKSRLGPEKTRLYQDECDKRAAAHKHAAVLNLVVVVDQRLMLTAQQRAKLVDALTAKYQESWEQAGQFFTNNPQYLPLIPDAQIVPLLSDKQKTVWGKTEKMNFSNVRGGFMRGQQFEEGTEIREIAGLIQDEKDDAKK